MECTSHSYIPISARSVLDFSLTLNPVESGLACVFQTISKTMFCFGYHKFFWNLQLCHYILDSLALVWLAKPKIRQFYGKLSI